MHIRASKLKSFLLEMEHNHIYSSSNQIWFKQQGAAEQAPHVKRLPGNIRKRGRFPDKNFERPPLVPSLISTSRTSALITGCIVLVVLRGWLRCPLCWRRSRRCTASFSTFEQSRRKTIPANAGNQTEAGFRSPANKLLCFLMRSGLDAVIKSCQQTRRDGLKSVLTTCVIIAPRCPALNQSCDLEDSVVEHSTNLKGDEN